MNASVNLFEDDDAGHLWWIAEHPDGYVVNIRRRLDPGYVVLHRANCFSIERYPTMRENPGGFTERAYRKLCAMTISEIEADLARRWGAREPFSKICSLCAPERGPRRR